MRSSHHLLVPHKSSFDEILADFPAFEGVVRDVAGKLRQARAEEANLANERRNRRSSFSDLLSAVRAVRESGGIHIFTILGSQRSVRAVGSTYLP